MVPEPVRSGEIILRCSSCYILNYGFKNIIVREREEYRFNVGIVDSNMLHAILFFIASGKLMLFYALVHVVINVGSNNNTVLGASLHCLGIYIIMLLIVLNEPSVILESIEIFHSLVIHFRRVLIFAGFEVDFRLYDVVK